VHHLIFDVEVELTTEEAAKILVDEVVEGVPCGVAAEVGLKARVIGFFSGGGDVRLGEF
jgi:hypothetical protein